MKMKNYMGIILILILVGITPGLLNNSSVINNASGEVCIMSLSCPGDGGGGGGGGSSDTTPPTFYITNPSHASTVSGNLWITVYASDSGSGMDKVKFYIDGSFKYTDTSAPFQSYWSTPLYNEGQHIIKAVAYDNAGNTKDDIHTVYVDNNHIGPELEISDYKLVNYNLEAVSGEIYKYYEKGNQVQLSFDIRNNGDEEIDYFWTQLDITAHDYGGGNSINSQFKSKTLSIRAYGDSIDDYLYTFSPFGTRRDVSDDVTIPFAFNVGDYTITKIRFGSVGYSFEQSVNIDFSIFESTSTKKHIYRIAFVDTNFEDDSGKDPQYMFNVADSRFDDGKVTYIDGVQLRRVNNIVIQTKIILTNWIGSEYGWYSLPIAPITYGLHVQLTNEQVRDKLKSTYNKYYGQSWNAGKETYSTNSGFDLLFGLSSAVNQLGNTGWRAEQNLAYGLGGNYAGSNVGNDYFDELIQHETSHHWDVEDWNFGSHVMNNNYISLHGFYYGHSYWVPSDADFLEGNSNWYNQNDYAPS